MPSEHVDVLIVGAGLSGIGAGYHLQANCPGKSYLILEGRDCIGGTWDLFRYPGIRSDSDMFTLGYSFKPWLEAKAIADVIQNLRPVRDRLVLEPRLERIAQREHVAVGADAGITKQVPGAADAVAALQNDKTLAGTIGLQMIARADAGQARADDEHVDMF